MSVIQLVSGTVSSPAASPFQTSFLTFLLSGPDLDGNEAITPEPIKVSLTSDRAIPSGFGLWPNHRGVRATRYQVWLTTERVVGAVTSRDVYDLGSIQLNATGPKTLAQWLVETPGLEPGYYRVLTEAEANAMLLGAQAAQEAAELSASQSHQSSLVAQAARDAATTAADVFADTAAGLAGTSLGDQFQVVSGDQVARYRHDAGPVATEVARYPTSARVETEITARKAIVDDIGPADIPGQGTMASVFTDEDGVALAGLRSSDGRMVALSSAGSMDFVTVESDQQVRDVSAELAPGLPAGLSSVAIDLNSQDRVVGAKDEFGRNWFQREHRLISEQASHFDLVVYGDGLGALCAARSAFEMGLTVCIVTPNDRLGGMMSGGISVLDTAQPNSPTGGWLRKTGGLSQLFAAEIRGVYHPDFGNPRRFQARAAQAVANRWGLQYVHRVIFNSQIHDRWQSLVIEYGRVTGINTSEGLVSCSQVIDASYTGDLLRWSGASWTATREAASADELDAGFRLGDSSTTTGVNAKAAAIAMGYEAVPAEAYSLNTMTRLTTLAGLPTAGSAVETQMAFSVRANITNAADRVPFGSKMPDSYDRRRYLIALAEAVQAGATSIWHIIDPQDGVAAVLPLIPGQASSEIWNTNGGFSSAYRAPGFDGYATANWAKRQQLRQAIIDQHVGYFTFFATDPAVTALLPALQADILNYGWCPWEWVGSPYGDNIPHLPYERQTIRMVNDYILTKPKLKLDWDDPLAPTDVLGLFEYNMDVKPHNYYAHDTTGDGSSLTLYREGYCSNSDSGLYAIPLSACLPRRTEVSNLSVAWCVATTDLAWRSLRMEPSAGTMGEALGLLAALALKNGVDLHDVNYADLRALLVARGNFLFQ